MAIAKTIEIMASSPKTSRMRSEWHRQGIGNGKGIEGAWIKDTKVVVRNDQIVEGPVTLAVTFIVD